MYRLKLILLLMTALPLFSLEIRLNDRLYENFSDETLADLSYFLPRGEERGIYLRELLPLMEEVHGFRFISGDYIMETDPAEDLRIEIGSEGHRLRGDSIGVIPLPRIIEIEGPVRSSDKLLVWLDRHDSALMREMDLFARLHRIQIEYRVEKNLSGLLEYNSFNGRGVPDLIVFNETQLNRLSPLLSVEDPRFDNRFAMFRNLFPGEHLSSVPFKMSRQICLGQQAATEQGVLSADFGDLNLFYPLLYRFGLEGLFQKDSRAAYDAFLYLKNLHDQGKLPISSDPEQDYLSGKSLYYYGPSSILGKISGDSPLLRGASLPQLGGENPDPLLVFTLLSRPAMSGRRETAGDMIDYLTGYGVQQRIDPETGYMPVDESVFPILPESPSKTLLMENLDEAPRLVRGELNDKLAFVLPKVYRLIISGRLSIEDGLAEIEGYLNR